MIESESTHALLKGRKYVVLSSLSPPVTWARFLLQFQYEMTAVQKSRRLTVLLEVIQTPRSAYRSPLHEQLLSNLYCGVGHPEFHERMHNRALQ